MTVSASHGRPRKRASVRASGRFSAGSVVAWHRATLRGMKFAAPERRPRRNLAARLRRRTLRRQPPPSPRRPWPTISPARPAPTSCSTRTTPWTGGRGDRRRWSGRAQSGKPILLSIGYAACHWCHVMERESFEDEATARADERALRVHQGRSRGAARPRRHLHAGDAGDDGTRRLADDRVPHAARASRSTPARTSRPTTGTACRRSAACWPAWPTRGTTGRTAWRARRRRCASCTRRARSARASPARSTNQLLTRAVASAAPAIRAAVRRLRRRAQVPADDDARLRAPAVGAHAATPTRCTW